MCGHDISFCEYECEFMESEGSKKIGTLTGFSGTEENSTELPSCSHNFQTLELKGAKGSSQSTPKQKDGRRILAALKSFRVLSLLPSKTTLSSLQSEPSGHLAGLSNTLV